MQVGFMRAVDFWVGVPVCALLTIFRKCYGFIFGFFNSGNNVQQIKSNIEISKQILETQIQTSKISHPLNQNFQTNTNQNQKNTLFIELSEMGSAILVDPALRAVKDKGHKLFFVIFNKNKSSLSLLNTVESSHIFGIRSEGFLVMMLDVLKFFIWCRQNKINVVIDLELFSRFTSLLSFFSGAKQRIGFTNQTGEGLYRGDLFTDYVYYNPHIHITKNFMALVEPLVDPAWSFEEQNFVRKTYTNDDVVLAKAEIKDADKIKVKNKMESFLGWNPVEKQKNIIVLLNPNAGDMIPQRRWPMTHFMELAQHLLKDPRVWILVTGSPAEKNHVTHFVNELSHDRVKNFAGEVLFTELPALYSLSDLLITNDSGPGHFSSVTEIKTFVLFGPETPDLYGPIGNTQSFSLRMACSPCVSANNHRDTRCNNNLCMKNLSPKWVAESAFQYFSLL